MLKIARKASTDPVQERLRQNKALLNKDISELINNVIHFKKTINGSPSKFYAEKGDIKNPIPGDPLTILNSLTDEFQKISQKCNDIVQEQIEYSKNRKKSRPKNYIQNTNNSNTVDLPNQRAHYSDYNLMAEGSNRFSRFFTRIMNPTIGFGASADLRKTRMSMLSSCVDVYKSMGTFQVYITKTSKESITESKEALNDAWVHWSLITRLFIEHKNKYLVNKTTTKSIENQVNKQDKLDTRIQDEFNDISNKNIIESTSDIEKTAQDFLKKWIGKTIHNINPFGKTSRYRLSCYNYADKIRVNINKIMDLLESRLDINKLEALISETNRSFIQLKGITHSLYMLVGK